ncbi:NUDIX domain-containing protein [Hoyosella sp. YIM 151337]|uniref:NUDIX hydrolase n=1 Tax=Hoyosella sp. YIM 151337 TaxID=2992742 RepID=UPI0022369D5B|nr:NUDIX domain-containing protein [Hoyosella sp. YIM 151337]MCW4352405.1 NUDIX domain-containing protein [Hoyosella sp. YIM 151337]
MTKPITVAGVCFLSREHILLVRKRGTALFMLPGGKPEPAESIYATAVRECQEELNVALGDDALRFFARWMAPAANEAGRLIDATVFVCERAIEPQRGAEIGELRWVSLDRATDLPLAPLLATYVLPALTRIQPRKVG